MSEAPKRFTPTELATVRKAHFDTYDGEAGYCRVCDCAWPCMASLLAEEDTP